MVKKSLAGLQMDRTLPGQRIRDNSTPEQSETSGKEYADLVVARYAEARAIFFEDDRGDAHLPDCDMPPLEAFGCLVGNLRPYFEAFADNDWEPEVLFVPKGLGLATWNALLTGHLLADEASSGGIRLDLPHNHCGEIANRTERIIWDVAVICAREEPVFIENAPRAFSGFGAERYGRLLATAIGGSAAVGDYFLGRAVSPQLDTYLALHLSRLVRGERPVDTATWTIARERLGSRGVEEPLCIGWSCHDRAVYCGWWRSDWRAIGGGYRPTVTGTEVNEPIRPCIGGMLGKQAVARLC